jgi:cytochrome b pre-mRNA-processing protein 3
MFARLFQTQPKPGKIAANSLYQAIVRQSRRPDFYLSGQVPDTPQGRFDLIMLHAALVTDKLIAQGASALAQDLFDIMFKDIEKNLLELGVSDIRIGKFVKKLMQGFKGRAQGFRMALAGSDEILAETLQRNLYAEAPVADEAVQKMARYTRRQADYLQQQDLEQDIKFLDLNHA